MSRFTTPNRARLHIADLRAYGISNRTIAHMCGMASVGQIDRIIRTTQHIRVETERRILRARFDLDAIPDDRQLDVMGSRRRLRALVRMGWNQQHLADRVGIDRRNLNKIIAWHRQRYVTAGIARSIRDVYDELSLTRGPDNRVAVIAKSRGWHGPFAWDDDTIDHPDTRPVEDVERVATKVRRPGDVAEDVEFLLNNADADATARTLAARLGYEGTHGLQKALESAERFDLLDRLADNAARAGHNVANRRDTPDDEAA